MTSVAPLRSIFHPLAKWTTCLQGTKLTHFFPSLAFSVCLYLMYCISVLLPCKLPFPTHVGKKKSHRSHIIYLVLQKHFLSPNSRDIPYFFPPPQKTILLPISFPFWQPYFCQYRSPYKLEVQWSRRQHQPNSPAPEQGLWQEQSNTPGASSRGCSSLLLGSKDHSLAQKLFWSSFLFSCTRDPSLEM